MKLKPKTYKPNEACEIIKDIVFTKLQIKFIRKLRIKYEGILLKIIIGGTIMMKICVCKAVYDITFSILIVELN